MVKVHKDIEDNLRWRTGVVLTDTMSGTQAVVKADLEARRINIWVQGKRSRDYLHYLRYLLVNINSSFKKVSVSERVPLPDEPHASADYETLLNHANQGSDVYFAEGSKKPYSVKELLGLVQPKDMKELDGLVQKIEPPYEEKLTVPELLNGIVESKLTVLGITFNLHRLFDKLLAREKQKRQ